MNYCFYLLTLLLCSTLSAQQTTEFTGVWQVDSSAFIYDGVQGSVAEPILPVTWTFHANGRYELSNGNIQGRYSLVTDSLQISMSGTGTSMDYRVLELSDSYMVLHSTIYRTEDNSMETISYLSKKNGVKPTPVNDTEHE